MVGLSGNMPWIQAAAAPAAETGATVQGKREAKAKEAATDFEATFLAMVLKEMRQSLDDGLFPGDSGDVHGGLFDLYLGRHLAAAGGVGLAASLAPNLTPPPVAAAHGPSPADRPAARPAR